MNWKFNDTTDGSFTLIDPDKISYLYFPLVNEKGMMSSITPSLNGDIKTDQNSFLLQPVSVNDLHNNRSNRNFWINIRGYGPWSVTGNSARQIAAKYKKNMVNTSENYKEESVKLEAGFLWHKVIRENHQLNLKAEITNFVPVEDDQVELMKVTITNTGNRTHEIVPTAAIPIYGRSADNLRDHRHVTSLLHQIKTNKNGVIVKPTLSFDERGHQKNNTSYAVMGRCSDGSNPESFYPVLQDFIGEGGTLDWPRSIVENRSNYVKSGYEINGYESMGGLRFGERTLEPGKSVSYIIVMAINHLDKDISNYINKYCSLNLFNKKLSENKNYWQNRLEKISFYTGDKTFDKWMKWVSLQPILRRLYGNSFLPHHDYGRGGRGWRDLWQDCLALLLMEDENVRHLLYSSYAGVRIDGSNATIIGNKPGEFVADRNNITRLWIDHGAWPLLTSKFYIDMTGDLNFLLEKQSYFKDNLVSYTKDIDEKWTEAMGNKQKTVEGKIYQGTILEHILLENLTVFFNVGENNNICLEDADWNDGLDMASDRGESVAFTAFYAGNLLEIVSLLERMKEKENVSEVKLLEEIKILLDSLFENHNYNSVDYKSRVLERYFDNCKHKVSGNKVNIPLNKLIKDIKIKAEWMIEHLRNEEWTGDEDGYEWFNGYYDNYGQQVDGSTPKETRMILTGQVFTTMFGIATDKQVEKITHAADKYLYDKKVGGYRLNTRFTDKNIELGRCFGFAYGHKENGAMFSHMAVMYANALYKRGFVKEGYKVWNSIYQHCIDFEKSRIYPGIPEYINERGRGLYSFLTGSASWLLLTMVIEVFGVKGDYGNLKFEPKLMKEQFDSGGKASIEINFANKKLKIIYINSKLRKVDEYSIKSVKVNGEKDKVNYLKSDNYIIIDKKDIEVMNKNENVVTVELD